MRTPPALLKIIAAAIGAGLLLILVRTCAGVVLFVGIGVMVWRTAVALRHGVPSPTARTAIGQQDRDRSTFPTRRATRPLEGVLAELDAMTGWASVKAEVHKLVRSDVRDLARRCDAD